MVDTDGGVLQARGTAEEWHLKIWFEDGSGASVFQQCCANQGIPLTVERLTSLSDIIFEDYSGVSKQQEEAIALAYQRGYFDEPRRVSQEDLADELGISSSAVGGRLRRGLTNLIEETIID